MSEVTEVPVVDEAPIVDAVCEEVVAPEPISCDFSAKNLLTDVELALKMFSEMKQALSNAHPSVWWFVKGLF